MKVDLRKSRSTMVDQEVMDDGFALIVKKIFLLFYPRLILI